MAKKKPPAEPAEPVEPKQTLKIWTRAYRPFIMGGNVNAPIGCHVEIDVPFAAGMGLYVHEIVSPNTGRVCVAESKTGAIVGDSVDMVRDDILAALRNGDEAMMKKQLDTAADDRDRIVETVTAAYFWREYDRT